MSAALACAPSAFSQPPAFSRPIDIHDPPSGPVYFGEWQGLCDGAGICAGVAYASIYDAPGYVLIRSSAKGPIAILVGRRGEPPGPARARRLRIQIVDEAGRITWSKTAAAPGGVPSFFGARIDGCGDLVKMTRALETGRTVRLGVVGVAGPPTVIALNGVARTLPWLRDHARFESQPSVRRADPVSQAHLPTTPPPSVTRCETDARPPSVARLAPGRLLWLTPCRVGDERETRLDLTDEAGVALPSPAVDPPLGGLTLETFTYDSATRTLTAATYRDATRSCGNLYQWAWDGVGFRFFTERHTGSCRGLDPADWPSGYRLRLIDR